MRYPPLDSVSSCLPVAPYIGGKRSLSKKICEIVSAVPHDVYAEPFIGMGGIFFRRQVRPKVEVVNDISADVVTLFRIRRNIDPEGAPFEPCKSGQANLSGGQAGRSDRPTLRSKAGRIKRRRTAGPMFRKMGQASALAWEASADGVAVGYAETALARIARVHQFGLRNRVTRQPSAPEAQYPARTLLGLTADDRRQILQLILANF